MYYIYIYIYCYIISYHLYVAIKCPVSDVCFPIPSFGISHIPKNHPTSQVTKNTRCLDTLPIVHSECVS